MKERIRFGIVGSGALGGYYGAKLAHAGCDVHFLMRSDLEAVRRDGLTIRSKDGDFHLPYVEAHGSPEEMGPCDVVLIALKTTSNAALPGLIPPLLYAETALVTLQNGLGNEELLAAHFGARRVMGGLCFVCLNRTAPGVVEHFGHGTLSIGEFKGPPQDRTMRMVTDFQRAGVDAKAVQSLITERWRKLVWNIPFNGLGIAAAANVAQVLNDEQLCAAARALMAEVIGRGGQARLRDPAGFYRRADRAELADGGVPVIEPDRLRGRAGGRGGSDLGRAAAPGARRGRGDAAAGVAARAAAAAGGDGCHRAVRDSRQEDGKNARNGNNARAMSLQARIALVLFVL